MSRRGPEIDFNPLLEKVQRDISFLSYLGLHQYAKQQKLIGRSRPMITKDMDFVMQRRLNFRLLVACIQQIVGRTHYDHGNRIEQVNYVNVGNYAQLRLYGLLDREMFALDTDADTTLTGWWPGQLNHTDVEVLGSPASIDTMTEQLSYNARATIEIGGETFLDHMRTALRFINMNPEITPHSQRDPRNRMRVKNLSLNLQLIETRPYETNLATRRRMTAQTGTNINVGFVDVPCHIERLLHFRDTVWPWVQRLSTPEAKEAFKYVKQNYPGMQAITIKIREIRTSVQETLRREREADEAREERERAQAQLRERLITTYGEPVPEEERAVDDTVITMGDVQEGLEDTIAQIGEELPRGYHGRELEPPGVAFDRRIEENRAERARVYAAQDIHLGNGLIAPRIVIDEDEPYDTHVLANFEDEDAEHPPPDTPEFGYVEQNGNVVVLPVPDVHDGMDDTTQEQVNDIATRLRIALGMDPEDLE